MTSERVWREPQRARVFALTGGMKFAMGCCMAWCYELRGFENRLIGRHSGFKSERAARVAGQYAKRAMECICYPNSETLTLVTKENDATTKRLTQVPKASGRSYDSHFIAKHDAKTNLKYAWQKPVLDAFQERNPKNQLRKIVMAEHAVSDRLCNPAPFGVDERAALRKLLPVLRKLLHQTL